MTFYSRLLVFVAAGLLAISPVRAQSDNGGVVPQSDVSGNLTQSDVVFFQTDEARIKMNDVASSLAEALRRGTLGSSVIDGNQQFIVPPTVTALLMGSSVEAVQPFADELTARGLSASEATTLANAAAGLLDGGTVSPPQFLQAVDAFNGAVNGAPAGFLADPPHEFVVVRGVLMALLDGTV